MKLFNKFAVVALAGGLSLVGAQSAKAATLTVDCTSPGVDINPPASATFGPSVCGTLGALPVGAIITDVSLLARYSVSLELGGVVGTADFGHTTNIGDTTFDNGGATTPTTASQPFLDVSVGPIACPSAACTAAIAALQAGTVQITSYVDNPTGQTSSVSADYEWTVNYRVEQVPEPTSLVLFGLATLGAGIVRRRK